MLRIEYQECVPLFDVNLKLVTSFILAVFIVFYNKYKSE
jgi:hypothetical protein